MQDQWTIKRLTVSGALRYDHVWSHFPQQQLGPNPFFPTAVIYDPSDGVSYNDITPRFGAAYDVFGNGKTALKVNIGKYLVAADGSSITGGLLNPLSRVSHDGEPHVDRCQPELPARLRPAQPTGAGSQGVGRRLLRPQQQPELRPRRCSAPPTTRTR